jgi:hypothetical protein
LFTITGDGRLHAGSSSIDPCDESYVPWRGLLSAGAAVDAMSEFTVYPRSDCGDEHPERFAILNAFVDELETE